MHDDRDDKVTPGINPKFRLENFTIEEQQIINRLKSEWYLTSGGPQINLGASQYCFFLMKPTHLFTEMFNIDREIVCVFSSYARFEPRTLDAFDAARSRLQDLRLETVCCVLISKDKNVETAIEQLLKTEPEQPIVIPFSYEELLRPYDAYFIRNRFRKHFFTRDLFSFLSPLKKDLYFYGRSALIHEIANRHRSGEHTGLFGLRKSGKTSIIYAVERLMQLNAEHFVSIDCENPSLHKLRWYEFLHKLVMLYHRAKESSAKVSDISEYNEKAAADKFTEDMLKIYASKKRASTLIIFDEIERVSPRTGSSSHWRDGDDFVYLWQTLRGFYQRNRDVLTYMIVGTNPTSVEQSMIGCHENPLFSSVPSQYVPAFTLDQVREMVRKLGRYMGIRFDELVYAKMTDDFGGHPFLIRQVCSYIHNICSGDRPVTVDKALYNKAKKEFINHSGEYLEMITQVLHDWYPDEYDMLTFLANNDLETFKTFAADHMQYTRHLIGYGLINASANGHSFNIECIKEHMSRKHRFEKINLSDEEKLQEITVRRNRIEKNLRTLVRNSLRVAYGKRAGEHVLAALPEERRRSISMQNIESLLDRDKSPLYFINLIEIINREWSIFQNLFEMDKDKILLILREINTMGRPDAHARGISEDDFTQIRLYFKKIEDLLQQWST